MLREHIAHALPEGVGQPLFSRVLTGSKTTHWVRAGDIRHRDGSWVFDARWDGDAFVPLWDAAVTDSDEDGRPRVEFAVRVDGALEVLADTRLGHALQAEASRAQRQAQVRRRRLRRRSDS